MKKTLAFTLLFAILLIPCADAKLPFFVRTIYFQPTDAPPAPDNLAQLMLDVKEFYRDQMISHGYGPKTFRLEANEAGGPRIHIVKGRHSAKHYKADTYANIKPELPVEFLNFNNVHVIFVGGLANVDVSFLGKGACITGGASGGFSVIASDAVAFGMKLIAHEIGHSFCLVHNATDDASIMMWGNAGIIDSHNLNAYETRWLDKHHYFNAVHHINHIPEFSQIHRIQEVKIDVLRFRYEFASLNGLHQVQTYSNSNVEILAWKPLEGERNEVDFLIERAKLKNERSISVQVMGSQGNINTQVFSVADLPFDMPRPKPTADPTPEPPRAVSSKYKMPVLWATLKRL